MAAKIIYVSLRDLAEFNKVDEQLLLKFFIEYGYLKDKNTVTQKGMYAKIQIAENNGYKFLLFNKNMDLRALRKYRCGDAKKKVGDDYEKFVASVFKKKGYMVKFNGFEEGEKDQSVDLVAFNHSEVILIQCKNWSMDWVKKNNKYIDHKEAKSFLHDTDEFIKENQTALEGFKIKKLFVVSDKIFSKSGYAVLLNEENVSVSILSMKK